MRVRRAAYVDARIWTAAGASERYRLSVVAVARTRPGDVLSHHAALATYGLPLWGFRNESIDVESNVQRVTSRRGITFHPRSVAPAVEVDGVPVVPVARALVGAALWMGRDCAVVAGDQALRTGLVTTEQLVAEVARVTPPRDADGRTRPSSRWMGGASPWASPGLAWSFGISVSSRGARSCCETSPGASLPGLTS